MGPSVRRFVSGERKLEERASEDKRIAGKNARRKRRFKLLNRISFKIDIKFYVNFFQFSFKLKFHLNFFQFSFKLKFHLNFFQFSFKLKFHVNFFQFSFKLKFNLNFFQFSFKLKFHLNFFQFSFLKTKIHLNQGKFHLIFLGRARPKYSLVFELSIEVGHFVLAGLSLSTWTKKLKAEFLHCSAKLQGFLCPQTAPTLL